MPSLRELVDACIAELSADRDIWKQHCQKAECELAEAQAERGRLSRKWGEAKAETDQLRKGLAEARADWARLATERHEAKIITVGLRKERAEAKATIERLQAKVGEAAVELALLKAETDGWRRLLDVACEEEGKTKADADLGKMVRGMQKHTALMKTLTTYWAYWTHDSSELHEWTSADQPLCSDDPAEALRAIQEVGDAGA